MDYDAVWFKDRAQGYPEMVEMGIVCGQALYINCIQALFNSYPITTFIILVLLDLVEIGLMSREESLIMETSSNNSLTSSNNPTRFSSSITLSPRSPSVKSRGGNLCHDTVTRFERNKWV